MPVTGVEEVRERMQCQRRAATESPKEAHSRVLVLEVQPAGVCAARRWAKASLTSTREKRTAQRRMWDVDREATTERAERSQDVAGAASWWGQDQSKPERVALRERKADVVGSGVVEVGVVVGGRRA